MLKEPKAEPKARTTSLKVYMGLALAFTGLAILIIVLGMVRTVSIELMLLMLIGLVGLYVGVLIMVLVYRLVHQLK